MVPNFSRLTLFLMRSRSASSCPAPSPWRPPRARPASSPRPAFERLAERRGGGGRAQLAHGVALAERAGRVHGHVLERQLARDVRGGHRGRRTERPDGPTVRRRARGCDAPENFKRLSSRCESRCAVRETRAVRGRKARACDAPGRNAYCVRSLRPRVSVRRADECARRAVRGGRRDATRGTRGKNKKTFRARKEDSDHQTARFLLALPVCKKVPY